MKKSATTPDNIAAPVGPYSHSYSISVAGARIIFTSGQCGVDSDGNVVGDNDMYAQTRQTLLNIEEVLKANGASFDDVIKTTTYVTDISRRADVSRARADFLPDPLPTSTFIEVSNLVEPDYLVEIEVIAVIAEA